MRQMILATILISLGGGATGVAAAEGAPPSTPTAGANTPSAKLTKAWLRWLMGQPWEPGPIPDQTGANCGMGQDGPVWFLAGTTGGPVTRHCTIPQGKQLYFPLINHWIRWWDWQLEIPENMEMAAAAFDYTRAHTCTLILRLDGEDVLAGGFDAMADQLWVNTYEPFDVVVNEQWGEYGPYFGPMFAHGGGYYARMHPLTPGDHVLEFGGSLCDGGSTLFETSAKYYLHIGQ